MQEYKSFMSGQTLLTSEQRDLYSSQNSETHCLIKKNPITEKKDSLRKNKRIYSDLASSEKINKTNHKNMSENRNNFFKK